MLPISVKDVATQRGISRRDFLKFCSMMAGVLVLPRAYSERIENALAAPARLPVIWLEFQDCAGCTEALLRSTQPTVSQLVLDILSVDYHETIMAAAGIWPRKRKRHPSKQEDICWLLKAQFQKTMGSSTARLGENPQCNCSMKQSPMQ